MKIILMPDHLVDETNIEEKIFGKNYTIASVNNNSKNKVPEKLWRSYHGILVWHHCKIDKEIIDKLENCKVIVRIGVGFDSIDLLYAKKKNIKVCNVPDYGTNDVADHAISLMLSLARGINKFNYEIRTRLYR